MIFTLDTNVIFVSYACIRDLRLVQWINAYLHTYNIKHAPYNIWQSKGRNLMRVGITIPSPVQVQNHVQFSWLYAQFCCIRPVSSYSTFFNFFRAVSSCFNPHSARTPRKARLLAANTQWIASTRLSRQVLGPDYSWSQRLESQCSNGGSLSTSNNSKKVAEHNASSIIAFVMMYAMSNANYLAWPENRACVKRSGC